MTERTAEEKSPSRNSERYYCYTPLLAKSSFRHREFSLFAVKCVIDTFTSELEPSFRIYRACFRRNPRGGGKAIFQVLQ